MSSTDREVPHLTMIGYFAKEIASRPAWADAPPMPQVCSVSHCVSRAPEGWIDLWSHNELGFYDDPQRARAAASGLEQARLFAYRFLPKRFRDGEEEPWEIPRVQPTPLQPSLRSRGFDAVSRSSDGALGFECSPLTCCSAS